MGIYKDFSSIPKDVKFAMVAIAISWFFWGPIDAYYSLFLKSFGMNYSQIGWLLSLLEIVCMGVTLVYGLFSDKFSARKTLLFVLVGYMIVPLMFFYAGMSLIVTLLIVSIISMGILKQIRNISMTTYIKENTPNDMTTRVWTFYEILVSGLWSLGLILGGILVIFFEIYYLYLLVIIGVFIKFIFFLRVSEPTKPIVEKHAKIPLKDKVKSHVKALLNLDSEVHYMLFLCFAFQFCLGSIASFLVLFVTELNFGLFSIGLLLGFIYSSYFFTYNIGVISSRLGNITSMLFGTFVMVISMLFVYYFYESYWWVVFIGFFAHYMAYLFIRPIRNGIIAAMTPSHMQGEISGLQFFFLSLGTSSGAIFFGFVGELYGLVYIFPTAGLVYFMIFLLIIHLKFKYEKTVSKIDVHPHGSFFSMFNIGHLGHSIPYHINFHIKKNLHKRHK